MNRTTKVAIVLAGYAAAVVAAVLAGYAYEARVNQPGVDTSGGMYAFGSSAQIFGVFGVVALMPTGLALYFMRGSERAWQVLSRIALALAITGPLFGAFFLATENLKGQHPELGILALVGMFRLMASPLLAIAFAGAAMLAAGRHARVLLWAAAGIEAAVPIAIAAKLLLSL